MRAVIQRVSHAAVRVDGKTLGKIGPGMVIFIAIKKNDTLSDAQILAEKLLHLRIFSDEEKKMNLSLMDVSGEILCISQFTLYGDCRKGRRPSYIRAARPDEARERFEEFLNFLQSSGVRVETGRFQAMMDVELVNDGPVTLLIDSEKYL